MVVDAVDGAEVLTEKVWATAEELQLPRIVALNRLDRDRASLFSRVSVARSGCHERVDTRLAR